MPASVEPERAPPKLVPLNRSIPSTTASAKAPLGQFFEAIGAWWKAFGYMGRNGLRRYHLAGVVVLGLITWVGFELTDLLTGELRRFLRQGLEGLGLGTGPVVQGSGGGWNEVLHWGATTLDRMLEWGVALCVFWLKIKLTKYLLLTLMAPFMSAIAGAVRERETGTVVRFTAAQLLRDLLRGVRIAAALLSMELALGLTLALLGLALTVITGPLALLLSPLVIAAGGLVSAYFYGAAVFDAVYEQAGLDWRNSLRRGWSDRYRLLGIGTVFSGLLAFPVVGLLLATFLGPMPCTVAAARMTPSLTP